MRGEKSVDHIKRAFRISLGFRLSISISASLSVSACQSIFLFVSLSVSLCFFFHSFSAREERAIGTVLDARLMTNFPAILTS